MSKLRLGVNIDHVATVRNARGSAYPDPVRAAILAQTALPIDKRNPEDIDTTSEDHLYDALRYGIMSRPRFSIFDYDPNGRPHGGMRVADATFGY